MDDQDECTIPRLMTQSEPLHPADAAHGHAPVPCPPCFTLSRFKSDIPYSLCLSSLPFSSLLFFIPSSHPRHDALGITPHHRSTPLQPSIPSHPPQTETLTPRPALHRRPRHIAVPANDEALVLFFFLCGEA